MSIVKEKENRIIGMSVSNPVEVEKDYLLYTVDYAAKMGVNHMQFIGPIHDSVKGNIDGMTLYRKYEQFNHEKDMSYIMQAMDAISEACKRTKALGIKTYVWHHELELPAEFAQAYPEVQNGSGDIEVTHSRIKDFLEHKIRDFFHAYPDIDGLILTLHETKIPLLKLKDQKLGKIERVKYVTQILYDECQKLGKELIVRPFASLEEDYVMMAKAYEEISTELLIMDKWTQFDWSLTLPNNAFYHKIKKNPLFVEGDIFGEFFGKGRLPLMLKEHMAEKFEYCEGFSPSGYVLRIDRAGEIPFGDINEVNLVIAYAYLNHKNVEKAIDDFFYNKYGSAAQEVRMLMEKTEDILRKTIYAKGLYFSELSFFPSLNQCKNHYYFEMMRSNCHLVSNEWFIPRDWKKMDAEEYIAEKKEAVCEASQLYDRLLELKDKMDSTEYEKLWIKFANLKFVTQIWMTLTHVLADYAAYFDARDILHEESLEHSLEVLLELNRQGKDELGKKFYCGNAVETIAAGADLEDFVKEIRESFRLEKQMTECIEKEDVRDYVVCGGAMEGHGLLKEVNFSDVLVRDNALCRIPGHRKGAEWSSINAHGWFSYEVAIAPNTVNTIRILMGSSSEQLDAAIDIGGQKHTIHDNIDGTREYCFNYVETEGKDAVRIRFDKISGCTPYIFWIKSC